MTFGEKLKELRTQAGLTQAQLAGLQSDGNEIGGHTVSHADLPTLDADEQKRQVCNDRVALLNQGFTVGNFAYPYGDANLTTKQTVASCGYNSARGVGDVVSPGTCDRHLRRLPLRRAGPAGRPLQDRHA